MEDLGADKKTQGAFAAIAEQKYVTSQLKPAELEQRIRTGRLGAKDVRPEDLATDDGAIAKSFALNATGAQLKDLTQSVANKAGYRKGLENALGVSGAGALAGADRQKVQAELMRMGKDPDPTKPPASAYKNSGLNPAGLAAALKGPLSSEILANLDTSDLTDPLVLKAIAENATASKLVAARSTATKDLDPTKMQNVNALIAALKTSTRAQHYQTERTKVRTGETDAQGLQKKLDQVTARLARTPTGTRAHGALITEQGDLTTDLAAAKTNLTTLQAAFVAAMAAAAGGKIEQQEQDLYESTNRQKAK
jgi:hypothetical protein